MKYLFMLLMLFLLTNTVGAMSLEKRIECGLESAIKYDIPADILLAISTIENGRYDVGYRNSNGSIDYGVMQINTIYIKELKDRYDMVVSPEDLLTTSCYSFQIAALKVSDHLRNDSGSFLQRVANYHSKTPDLNRYYQTLLIKHSSDWRKVFQSREYLTYIWSFNK